MEGILKNGQIPADGNRRPKKVRDPYDGLRPWSAITHGVGAVLGLVATLCLLVRSWGDPAALVVFAIYGLSMVGLYTASTLYHQLNTKVAGRIALRKYDHCSIYLLIAGSYTPICILALGGTAGLVLISAIWILAVAGIVLTLTKLDIPRWLCSSIYLAMGWLAVFAISPLSQALPAAALGWLFGGGVLYTIGGVLYAAKWPGRNNPRFGCHEIFHLFILLGSICHFVLMYLYIGV